MSYFYVPGEDGRHYCWAKTPVVECPVGEAGELPAELAAAAVAVGMDPGFMWRKVSHKGHRRRDDAGKLTMRCESCGHRLRSRGFAYWIEGPAPAGSETDSLGRLRDRLNSELFGGRPFVRVEGPWYAKTKRDAEAWARLRVRETKAVPA